MKKTTWQDVYFTVVVVVFLSLLFTGGSRLIAAPETGTQGYEKSLRIETSLSCPPESVAESFVSVREGDHASVNTSDRVGESQEDNRRSLVTDANGNVVIHCSYMHAVYQSFALGDGFV